MLRGVTGVFKRMGLQWRIMLYVSSGLLVFSAIYGVIAVEAIQQSTALVYRERMLAAQTLAELMDDTWEHAPDATGPQISEWLNSTLSATIGSYVVEVLDASGNIIASKPPGSRTTSLQHLQLVEPLWQAHQPGWRLHSLEINGQPSGHVIAFAPMEHFPWGVIVEQPVDEAFRMPRTLQSQLIGYGLIAVAAGLALAYLTTRPVVRPINALTNASQAIAAGELDHPLDVSGEGEIGRLARSFDDMRVNLRQSREEIARWNRELEARVALRTRELAALVASSHALTSTLELDGLFELVLQETRAVLPLAEGIAVFLYEPDTQVLVVRSSLGIGLPAAPMRFQIDETIAGTVFATQAPLLVRTAQDFRAHQANIGPGERAVQSVLGVPLTAKGTRLGVLMLYNFSREAAFAESEVPILQALGDQAAAAIDNARLYTELQAKEVVRTQLLEKLIAAQEEERKRIARDLHDEFAQTLTALTISLQSSIHGLPPALDTLKQQLVETHSLSAQLLKEISQWILELRPTALDDLGLVPAIRWYARNRLESAGTTVVVEATGFKRRLPTGIETNLFRIAQEAISNIAKHAHARRVHIRLVCDAAHVSIDVEDDGLGFEAGQRFTAGDGMRGLGQHGMRERATLVGGSLTIDSHPGAGTRVHVEVPWTETN